MNDKTKLLKIGELSKKADISCRTIRYYEELGLIHPTSISEGGFRLYNDNVLHKLLVIKDFKDLGFSLEEIKSVLLPKPEFSKAKLLTYTRNILNTQLDAINKDIDRLLQLRAKNENALKKLADCEKCKAKKCSAECGNKQAYIL